MLFILLTHSVEIYFYIENYERSEKESFLFSRLSKFSTSSYTMVLGEGYLDDDLFDVGGSGNACLRCMMCYEMDDG